MNTRSRTIRISPLFRSGIVSDQEEQLVRATLSAVLAADLWDVARALEQRVVGYTPPGHAGTERLRRLFTEPMGLTPVTELLLRELLDVAAAPGWTPDMRRRASLEALSLAGF